MRSDEMERQFQAAVRLLKKGDRERALAFLEQLIAGGSTNPLHASYLGVAMALTGRGLGQAEAQCKEAMVLGFLEPDAYLNLARIYTMMRRPEQALETLRKGIRVIPGNKKILAELQRLNPRRPAAFSMVGRDHWLNNTLGRMMRSKAKQAKAPKSTGSDRDGRGGGASGQGGGRVFGISIPTGI